MFKSDRLKKTEKVMDQFLVKFFRNSGTSLASALEKTPLTPNALSSFGLMLIFTSALLLATGRYAYQVTASILLFFSLIIDFADGSLARKKNIVTKFGDWFDAMVDEIREFFIIFCLAFGLYRTGGYYMIWILAFILLGTDALIMRTVNKFHRLVDAEEHASRVKGVVSANRFFSAARELVSVRLLRYAVLPVFAIFNGLLLYMGLFAIYGTVICLGFLFYCGITLWKRGKS